MCQLLHLHVKFIMFRLQTCLGGCFLILVYRQKESKRHKSNSAFQRTIKIVIICVLFWGSKTTCQLTSSHFLQTPGILLFGLVFQSGHQNARTSIHGSERRQSLGSKVQPRVPPPVPEPRSVLPPIPPYFSLLHEQLQVTDDLLKSAATCCQMLHGDVVQVDLLHFLVAGFVQKAEQVQHAVRGGTVTLQGSEPIAQNGHPICTEPCVPHCPLHQLHAPKIQGSVQEALQCWNFD